LQDPIRLRNLIREAELKLKQRGVAPALAQQVLAPVRALLHHAEFWQHQSAGLAIFSAPLVFRTFRISVVAPELAIASSRFHLEPLIPAVEADQRFHVLAVTQHSVRLFEGDLSRIREIEVPDMPESPLLAQGEREHLLQSHTTGRVASRRRAAIFHGHGGGEEDRKTVLRSYYRKADEAVCRALGSGQAPVILAAVEYLCPLYREVSCCPNLLAAEIHGSPDSLSPLDLRRRASAIASAHFRKGRGMTSEQYRQPSHTQQTGY
jgi:hypothetical protein